MDRDRIAAVIHDWLQHWGAFGCEHSETPIMRMLRGGAPPEAPDCVELAQRILDEAT